MDRTDSRMQATRWAACVEGLRDEPPSAGVLDTYPAQLLLSLLDEGWVQIDFPQEQMDDDEICTMIREAVLDTLADDVDCLATAEAILVEQMLIGDGRVRLDSVAEIEAAYTLHMRLWCDVGVEGGEPVARLDPMLMDSIPPLMMRERYKERRARVFIFEGMTHGILYLTGTFGLGAPCRRFVAEVLKEEETPQTLRLARNFMQASFDVYDKDGLYVLVHEAFADPEPLLESPFDPVLLPEITPERMSASMNGMLPEEKAPDEKLQRALHGALRPEYDTGEVAADLRFLAKQGAPLHTMQEIMAGMLVVMPTAHMNGMLKELRHHTPRWIDKGVSSHGPVGGQEYLH